MKIKLIMILTLISFIMGTIYGCSKKTAGITAPSGTYLSDKGNFEKVVIADNNRIRLYITNDTIISSVFSVENNRLVVKSNYDISFRILGENLLIGENRDQGNVYFISE